MKEINEKDLEQLNRAMFEIFGKENLGGTNIYTRDK